MSSNSNQLHRSGIVNNATELQRLGNISNINPESRSSPALFPPSYPQQPMAASNPSVSRQVPPLPPKRNTYMPGYNRYSPVSNYFSPFSRYTPGYPGYRMPPYGAGYGMSPFGAGSGMSPYGSGSDPCNSFVQMAEESTRPAFESIESVVHVVSSISMMLESTYHAVHSSYSAILGVVAQFSRLKDHFAHILSFLSILRWLRWMCLKVLYLLGARKENPSVEAAWDAAEKLANSPPSLDVPEEIRASAWPFFMFLGLVVGAPWLMFKLLAKNVAQRKPFDPQAFVDSDGKRRYAYAAYDFKATQIGELSFKTGERLLISPRSLNPNQRGGWYLACNEKQETGYIPSTYLKSLDRNTIRYAPEPKRYIVPEQNVNIPAEPVNVTNTIHNRELVEKSADSPDLVDVVVEKLPELPVENTRLKSNNNIGSD